MCCICNSSLAVGNLGPSSFYRRLKFTSDPLQANKLVSVNLPLLSLHLDEDKVGLLGMYMVVMATVTMVAVTMVATRM